MTNDPAPVRYGPIPYFIGISGHRALRESDRPVLEDAVRDVLDELRVRLPETALVLLSPLAEGADRLVAQIALKMGLRLHVVLPMSVAEYVHDFPSEDSRSEFESLLSQAELVHEIASLPESKRVDLYRRSGEYVARHSQLLLALWDGQPADQAAGTSAIVDWRLRVLPQSTPSALQPPDAIDSGPVYHFWSPRGSAESASPPGTLRKLFPVGRTGEVLPESVYHQLDRAINHFNADALWAEGELAENIAKSRAQLLPDDLAGTLPLPFRWTREAHAIADTLAVFFQRRTLLFHRWIYVCVLLAVLTYEICGQVIHREALGLLLYPLILALAFGLVNHVRRREFQNRFHDYRALAEGLRVEFFWNLAGLERPVEQFYLRRQRAEMSWIRRALRVCWSASGGDEIAGRTVRLDLVRDYWIKNQQEFFARKTPIEKSREHRYKLAIRGSLLVGLLLALCIGAILAIPNELGAEMKSWLRNDSWLEGALIMATSLPIVIAALLHSYRERIGLHSHVKQYEALASLFGKAWKKINDSETKMTEDEQRSLIEELGKEALVENGDWYLVRRDRPLQVPHGH